MEKGDEYYMREALKQAQKAYDIGEVPVGCVIVQGEKIIARAYNLRETRKNAIAHAEMLAIDKACKKLGGWRLPNCTLYVTLEPCPMCAGGIINARIDKVVYGASDVKSGSCGSLINLFELEYNHKPQLCGGVLERESQNLLSNFFKQLRMRLNKKEMG